MKGDDKAVTSYERAALDQLFVPHKLLVERGKDEELAWNRCGRVEVKPPPFFFLKASFRTQQNHKSQSSDHQ
jgi:hypothetical protein